MSGRHTPGGLDRTDEVMVSGEMAGRLELHTGDLLEASLVSCEDCLEDPSTWPSSHRFSVVGVTVAAMEVRPPAGFYLNSVLAAREPGIPGRS